jgi:hypothetical protein
MNPLTAHDGGTTMRALWQAIVFCLLASLFSQSTYGQWLMKCGPYAEDITSFVSDGAYLLIGTTQGVFRSTNGGTTWTAGYAGLTNSSVNALAGGPTGVIAGTNDGLYRSTDDGLHWTQANSGYTGTAIAFFMATPYCFAGGSDGVFRSSNNGVSWTNVSAGVVANVSYITVCGNRVFAGTSNAGVYWASIGGTSWTAVNNGLTSTAISALVTVDTNLVAATGGKAFISKNYGSLWNQIDFGDANLSIHSVAVCGTHACAGGSNLDGSISYNSSDNGVSWTRRSLPSFYSFHSYTGPLGSTGTCFYCCTEGTVMGSDRSGLHRSTDYGDTWTTITYVMKRLDKISDIASLIVGTGNTALIAGSSEGNMILSSPGLYRSTDSGQSWVHTISIPLTATAIGSNGAGGVHQLVASATGLRLSTDNGENWTVVNSTIKSARAIAVNCGVFLVSKDDGTLYLSSDAGSSWNQVTDGLTSTPINTFLFSGTKVFAGTEGDGILVSITQGRSWTTANSGLTNSYVNAIAQLGANLYAGTDAGVFSSADQGASWHATGTGIPDGVTSLATAGVGLYAGTASGVYGTLDDGAAWTPVSEGLTSEVTALAGGDAYLYALASDHIWMRALPELETAVPVQLAQFQQEGSRLVWKTLSETNNYGFYVQRKNDVASEYEDLPGAFVQGHGTTTLPHSYEYEIGSLAGEYRLKQIDLNGSIHFSDAISVLMTNAVADRSPLHYALFEAYPNPFNPRTFISCQLPVVAWVRLAVYDLLGNEVAVLLDGNKDPGSYEVSFNGSGLASGMYFYRLQVTDRSPHSAPGFVQTRKLLLVR